MVPLAAVVEQMPRAPFPFFVPFAVLADHLIKTGFVSLLGLLALFSHACCCCCPFSGCAYRCVKVFFCLSCFCFCFLLARGICFLDIITSSESYEGGELYTIKGGIKTRQKRQKVQGEGEPVAARGKESPQVGVRIGVRLRGEHRQLEHQRVRQTASETRNS